MKASLSLAQELRSIRNRNGHKSGPEEVPEEHRWQAEIEGVQQTLREVLQALARLSGVELPGNEVSPRDPGALVPHFDVKTLKDRIRGDLQAFSSAAATEMAKHAEEQSRTAIAAVQEDMHNRIEQAAGEFREELQGRLDAEQNQIEFHKQTRERVVELVQTQTDEFARWVWAICKGTETPVPVQIAKLLEPYAEEATARFRETFRQGVHDLVAEEERRAQERFQAMLSSFEEHVSALTKNAQQISERSSEAASKLSTLSAAAYDETKNFESKLREEAEALLAGAACRLESSVESSLEQCRQRLAQLTASSLDEERKAITETVSDLYGRLKQAAALLAQNTAQS